MKDFRIEWHGSISLLGVVSDEAKAWVAEHLPEDAQRWAGCCYVIEHRYVNDIVRGIRKDGLSI